MEGFLRYEFGGLIFGGAHTWRGLFSEFYGILQCGLECNCPSNRDFFFHHSIVNVK